MKRVISMTAAALLAGGGAGCSPTPSEPGKTRADAVSAWTRPPIIERVDRLAQGLSVSGVAEPGARVVLRSDHGEAFAASADAEGHFDVRVTASTAPLLLRPETQVGQDAAPSPDRLLVLPSGQGPIAVLRPGGATRRLGPAPALGAVDSDGRMRLVSGRTTPGAARVEVRHGGETVEVAPDADGFWSVMLAPRPGPDQVTVGGRTFVWPGEGAASFGALQVERAASGWRINWTGPDGGRQSTWLPDLAPS